LVLHARLSWYFSCKAKNTVPHPNVKQNLSSKSNDRFPENTPILSDCLYPGFLVKFFLAYFFPQKMNDVNSDSAVITIIDYLRNKNDDVHVFALLTPCDMDTTVITCSLLLYVIVCWVAWPYFTTEWTNCDQASMVSGSARVAITHNKKSKNVMQFMFT
jgi:hypothetical protein